MTVSELQLTFSIDRSASQSPSLSSHGVKVNLNDIYGNILRGANFSGIIY